MMKSLIIRVLKLEIASVFKAMLKYTNDLIELFSNLASMRPCLWLKEQTSLMVTPCLLASQE